MRCPFCNSSDLQVTDSRHVPMKVNRRRKCNSCDNLFSTVEQIVVKPNKGKKHQTVDSINGDKFQKLCDLLGLDSD